MNAPLETQLCLIRHAHAGDAMKWTGQEDARPLTEKGRLQSERLGLFLAKSGFKPDAILTSPKIRAVETAQLVAAPLGVDVVVVDALGGPIDIETVERLLRASGDPRRPILVGHDPDFSALAAELTGVAELPVRKAALVRIDLVRPLAPGKGLLRWLLPPDLLAAEP
ncbi:MAG: histidine phosphatase family protein [Candidatus Limnocylindrales bacterium]|jgi:phosphohistidine phosphatase